MNPLKNYVLDLISSPIFSPSKVYQHMKRLPLTQLSPSPTPPLHKVPPSSSLRSNYPSSSSPSVRPTSLSSIRSTPSPPPQPLSSLHPSPPSFLRPIPPSLHRPPPPPPPSLHNPPPSLLRPSNSYKKTPPSKSDLPSFFPLRSLNPKERIKLEIDYKNEVFVKLSNMTNSQQLNKYLINEMDKLNCLSLITLKTLIIKLSGLEIDKKIDGVRIFLQKIINKNDELTKLGARLKIHILNFTFKLAIEIDEADKMKEMVIYYLNELVKQPELLSPKCWSFFLFCCRNTNYKTPEVFESTIYLIKHHFSEFNHLDLITIFYMISKLVDSTWNDHYLEVKKLFQSDFIENKLREYIVSDKINFRNVAHIAWCLSWFGINKSSVWELIELLLLKNSHRCCDYYFASIMHSYSLISSERSLLTLFKENFDLKLLSTENENPGIDKVAFVKLLSSFSCKNAAILKHDDPSLPRYFNYIEKKIDLFTKEELIGLVSVFAELDFEQNPKILIEYLKILSLLEKHLLEQFDSLNITHISVILWSLGVGGRTDLVLAKRCLEKVFTFSMKELINTEPKFLRTFMFGASEILGKQKLTEDQKKKIMFLKNLTFERVTFLFYTHVLVEKKFDPALNSNPLNAKMIFKSFKISYIPEFIIQDYNVDFYLPGFFDLDLEVLSKKSKEEFVVEKNEIEGELKEKEDQDNFLVNQNLKSYSDFNDYFEKTRHNSLVIEINGPTHYILHDEVIKNSSKMKINLLQKKVAVVVIPSKVMKDISNFTLDPISRMRTFIEYLKGETEKYRK